MPQHIQKPTDIPVDDSNFLYFTVLSTITGGKFNINISFYNEVGELKYIIETLDIIALNTKEYLFIKLSKGFIRQISVRVTSSSINAGQHIVSCSLFHGTTISNGIFIRSLLNGWATQYSPLNYPNYPVRQPYPENSYIKDVETIPAANVSPYTYFPTVYNYCHIQAISIKVTTDANVANRQLYLIIDATTAPNIVLKANITQPASTTYFYSFIRNHLAPTNYGSKISHNLPEILMNDQAQVQVDIQNFQATDNITDFTISTKEGNTIS